MRGFPKHINTQEDLELCQQEFPQETQDWLQKKIEDLPKWFPTGKVTSGEGITDATHKVIEEKLDASSQPEKVQYELRDDPNSPILKMGLTRLEAETAVADIKVQIEVKPVSEPPIAEDKIN